MQLKTPIAIRREIKVAHTAISEQIVHADAALTALLKTSGPGTPGELAPSALKAKADAIRTTYTGKVATKYNLAMDSFAALENDIDYFSRQSILERAPLPTVPTPDVAPTPQENQSLLASMKRIEGELSFNRLSSQVTASTDEQLIGRWAAQAVRDGHFRLAALVTDVAEGRSGHMKLKAENALTDLSVPEADAHQESIDKVDAEHRDMKSAYHTLQTGSDDLRSQMHKATADFTGKPQETFTGV